MSDSEASSPLRKIKRPNCNCEGLKKQLNNLKDDLKKRDTLIQDQLKFLVEALAKQRVLLNKLNTKQNDADSLRKQFPITNEEELSKINDNIVPGSKMEYVDVMKSLIFPNGIRKNLRNIMSVDVTYAYNVDGVQGKKPLKALTNFYDVLLECIRMNGSENPEDELRKAIQLQKKRHFKTVGARKSESKTD